MRRILITIDGSENDSDSLRAALALCEQTGAALSVAHARPNSARVRGFGDAVAVVDDSTEAAARAAFDDVCDGRSDARFTVYEAEADAVIAWLGQGHDLVVIERLSAETGPEVEALNAALFETGRPVLLLPPKPAATTIMRPAVAWNATPLTARAVRSAIPLMQAAGHATVLVGSGAGDISTTPLLDYLASYGIEGHVRPYNSDKLTARARGRALIQAALDAQADLLVTGAFGEAAGGSVVGLGRATRKIVTAAPIAVLMQN